MEQEFKSNCDLGSFIACSAQGGYITWRIDGTDLEKTSASCQMGSTVISIYRHS